MEQLLGNTVSRSGSGRPAGPARTTETIGPARRGYRRRRRPCGLFGQPMCWACRYFMMHRRAGRCPRRRAEAVRRASYGPAKRVLLETLLALEQTRSGAWTIAAGRCELCPRCARRDGLPCRNPGRMRYSFSAFGFDLAALAGGSWASSCCGRPMGCRSTMWRWPPFWSGEGQKQAGAAEAAPALLCLHGQDQK